MVSSRLKNELIVLMQDYFNSLKTPLENQSDYVMQEFDNKHVWNKRNLTMTNV